jgi:UDPglucose 6-dehydrogenase
MKIAIIGFGFVGKALHSVLKDKMRFNALIVDPALSDMTFESAIADNPDIVFLCLPTPTIDGKCDDSLIAHYITKLKDFPGMVVIKSTVPPSTVDWVMTVRPTTVIWPELLREEFAQHDIKFPTIIVVGAPSDLQYQYIFNFIRKETDIFHHTGQYPHEITKIRRCTPIEASMFKYAVNAFLATKVLFFHQFYQWMQRSWPDASYETITKLLVDEGRIGSTHMKAPGEHGLGFSGSCFPKDVEALLNQIYHNDLTTFPLLNEVQIQNKQLRDSQE